MAEASVGSALARRHIGRRFAELRDGKGLTQIEAAKRWDRARATLQRWEEGEGTVRFRPADVSLLLEIYDASPEDRNLLLALTAETRNGLARPWYEDKTLKTLPDWFTLYWSLEDSAEIIFQFELELIPGLLQTERYASEIMRVPAGFVTPDESERRVAARMRRQASLLNRPRAPRLEVVLSEAALDRAAGMGAVGREQLQHLLKMTQQTNVDVRIVPWATGVHSGMASGGAFTLLQFPTNGSGKLWEKPLVYIDSPTGAMYLDKPGEVAVYELIRTELTTKALDSQATQLAMTTLLKGLPQ